MLRTLILALYVLVSLVAMFFFLLLACDIVDGRDQKLMVSPHWHATVTNETLALTLFLMFVAFAVACISLKLLSADSKISKSGGYMKRQA